MNHTHQDRVVERDPCKCAAYGCPMLGTFTGSTVGTTDWYCWLHFGKDAAQWQRITFELNHLRWLVEAIQEMRRHYAGSGWKNAYLGALQAIRLHQRKDLEKLEAESVKGWLRRLDDVLFAACAEGVKDVPVKQQRIEQKDSWTKVGFEVPVAA